MLTCGERREIRIPAAAADNQRGGRGTCLNHLRSNNQEATVTSEVNRAKLHDI